MVISVLLFFISYYLLYKPELYWSKKTQTQKIPTNQS